MTGLVQKPAWALQILAAARRETPVHKPVAQGKEPARIPVAAEAGALPALQEEAAVPVSASRVEAAVPVSASQAEEAIEVFARLPVVAACMVRVMTGAAQNHHSLLLLWFNLRGVTGCY